MFLPGIFFSNARLQKTQPNDTARSRQRSLISFRRWIKKKVESLVNTASVLLPFYTPSDSPTIDVPGGNVCIAIDFHSGLQGLAAAEQLLRAVGCLRDVYVIALCVN